MEASEKRQPVVLYQVPLLSELQVKSLIISSLPQLQLSLEHITLRKKEGKFQAFLMVPASQVDEICALKELTVGKQKVYVKRWYTEAQVFIGRLPDTLAIDDIRASLETEFGKIVKAIEGQPHEGAKVKLRHCYIQFLRDQDAENCLFSSKKIVVNKTHQLRPSRTYSMNESEDTDKKLFLKVIGQVDDVEELERVINQQFRKEGKLREKVRVQNNKATILFTSAQVADRVLQNFKGGKIGKYEVILRPFANKDSYTVFVGGLKSSVTPKQLEIAFKHYQPLLSCSVSAGSNPSLRNGTITFGCQQTFKRVLVEYKEDLLIRDVFAGWPYVTYHMNAKDRNDYQSFKKGKVEPNKKPNQGPMIPTPINFHHMYPMQQMGMYPPMGRPPMGNFAFSHQPQMP